MVSRIEVKFSNIMERLPTTFGDVCVCFRSNSGKKKERRKIVGFRSRQAIGHWRLKSKAGFD